VETGKYSDPRATDWVTECLIKRRDKIGKAWLSRGLPLDNFRVEQGQLAFDDLAEKYKVTPKRSYKVEWSVFDNSTGDRRPIDSSASSWNVPSAAGAQTGILAAAIRLSAAQSGESQVTVYLRQSANGWSAIGVDRK